MNQEHGRPEPTGVAEEVEVYLAGAGADHPSWCGGCTPGPDGCYRHDRVIGEHEITDLGAAGETILVRVHVERYDGEVPGPARVWLEDGGDGWVFTAEQARALAGDLVAAAGLVDAERKS